jgi:serine/threonine-protein kinase
MTQELPEGPLAGRYRLERELGSGGMATVYLAQDLAHERQVAVKVMKPQVAVLVGIERFINEIRTTARLKHPHVLPLFDSGAVGNAPFYVMPYIDGETLRARMRREGAMPVSDVVPILREVADALAYAHGLGIVHRDVKPDNVLLADRHVFLADFGIARALEGAGSMDHTMTGTAVIVGTPTYLAPEQAAGRSLIDHRADVYAFGVMAYEMLTGAPPFTGDTGPVIMAAHLTATPEPLASRRPDIPPALANLVMKCLEKRPEDRWQRMDDVLGELDAGAIARLNDVAGAFAKRGRRGVQTSFVVAAGLVSIAIATGWLLTRRAAEGPPAIGRLTHVTREPGLEIDPALSPDGRTLAYVAGPPGKRRVYVRQVDSGRPIPLTDAGVAGAQRRPDWSPDGTRIVFQAGEQGFGVRPAVRTGTLYTIPSLGGTPTRLLPPEADGVAITPAWSPDGKQIAYCRSDGIYVISAAAGGIAKPILITNTAVHSVRWSPDSSKLAYVAGGGFFVLGEEQFGNTENSSIHVVTVATGAEQRITSGDWLDVSPVWTADGRALLFVSSRGGGRDVYRIRLSRHGVPEAAAERVSSGLNAHGISLSRDAKLLAYSSYTSRANIWTAPILPDRAASVDDAQAVTSGIERTEKLSLSPDGRWLAYDSDRNGNADVWKVLASGGDPEPVTREPFNEFANDWSPDGSEILFHAIRGATLRDVLSVSADGTRRQSVAFTNAEEQHGSWSPDGLSVAYSHGVTANERYNVYVVSRARKGEPWGPARRLTTETGIDPKWSPDGRWIAYSRQGEVRLVSPDGRDDHALAGTRNPDGRSLAQYAVWSQDSRTIYFKASDDERRATIWAMPATGGAPRLLMRFDDPLRQSLRREFATDGERLYFTIAQDESDVWVMEIK